MPGILPKKPNNEEGCDVQSGTRDSKTRVFILIFNFNFGGVSVPFKIRSMYDYFLSKRQ